MMVPDWAGYVRHRAGFAEIIDERFYSLAWVERQILEGRYFVFANDAAAVIVEIRVFPTSARDLHFVAATGTLDTLIGELRREAEQWGREQGCITASIESREGWQRVLEPQGYELFQVGLRKEL